MTFCFDIDGVLAETAGSDYKNSKPIQVNINLVNLLFKHGHTIVLYTARGGNSGIDWREWTVDQMMMFGVKYHKLVMGKPAADFYIDDKMVTPLQAVTILQTMYHGF